MTIRGIEINFKVTSPTDMLRYKQAGERMEARGAELSVPAVEGFSAASMGAYIDYLNAQLRIYGDFLDEVYGDGVAEQLLGSNPSLDDIADINDELEAAFEQQGKDFGQRLKKYTPNRATRRSR